jgi:hypothetical protein
MLIRYSITLSPSAFSKKDLSVRSQNFNIGPFGWGLYFENGDIIWRVWCIHVLEKGVHGKIKLIIDYSFSIKRIM